MLAVNLSGACFMSQAVLPHMLACGSGRIINISSLIREMGSIGQANYAASKSRLFGLTKTLARKAAFQLKRAGKLHEDGVGITVNTVVPEFIATEMSHHVPGRILDEVTAKIPLGRLAKREEIGCVMYFPCAYASPYITCHIWGIDGGMDM